jgi:hypothetical protein
LLAGSLETRAIPSLLEEDELFEEELELTFPVLEAFLFEVVLEVVFEVTFFEVVLEVIFEVTFFEVVLEVVFEVTLFGEVLEFTLFELESEVPLSEVESEVPLPGVVFEPPVYELPLSGVEFPLSELPLVPSTADAIPGIIPGIISMITSIHNKEFKKPAFIFICLRPHIRKQESINSSINYI